MKIDANCEGCGTPLADYGVDWCCPNAACVFEDERSAQLVAIWLEQQERKEYERLKAKFEPSPPAER